MLYVKSKDSLFIYSNTHVLTIQLLMIKFPPFLFTNVCVGYSLSWKTKANCVTDYSEVILYAR